MKGRHTFKAGISSSTRARTTSTRSTSARFPGGTNNQNGRFEFLDKRAGGTGLAIANAALGLFTNYAELGQRAFTKWRALATDVFVQDSWRRPAKLTIEGGVRWVSGRRGTRRPNNIANFDPRFYDPASAAVINPATGRLVGGRATTASCCRATASRATGNDSVVAQDPAVLALFRGEPRGFSETHYNVFEPRLGASYQLNEKTVVRASGGVFHNRVTLNDSTLLGGNPPFQPQVTISNGSADNPAAAAAAAADLPFGINGAGSRVQAPDRLHVVRGVQREIPFGFIVDVTYVGRRGLYLQRERNINQLRAGTLQANPGVNIAALRPYKGYGVIRLSENAGRSIYNSLQISADRRYSNGLKVGFAYTLGKSRTTAATSATCCGTPTTTRLLGQRRLRSPARARRLLHLRPAVLPRAGHADQEPARRLADLGRDVLAHRHAVLGHPRTNDIAGVGDGAFGQPVDLVGESRRPNGKLSAGPGTTRTSGSTRRLRQPGGRHVRQRAAQRLIYNPGEQQWDIALFKNCQRRSLNATSAGRPARATARRPAQPRG